MKNFVACSILALMVAGLLAAAGREQCTSAIVSPLASADNRPLLWKNRDTDALSNKVVYVHDCPYAYLALTDADDASGRKCFAGLNAAGFGIMNTVAYNLPEEADETKDLEGIIMADALRTCRTVDDFEDYIKANLGPKFGSLANFGVIDASGGAVLFEVHNHGYQKYDAADATEKYLVNTNFSRSGKPGTGAGYLRFERAEALFKQFPPHGVAYQDILGRFTRDLGHVLLHYPELDELKTIPVNEDHWLYSGDCINRHSTASAVVMVGRQPDDSLSPATLWVIPGEPVCAIALPVWVEAGCSPDPLWNGPEAPLWKESRRIKDIIRPLKDGNNDNYLNATRLDNASGTGFLPLLRSTEKDIMARTVTFLQTRHTAVELADFQRQMAEKALAVMQSIR